MREDWPALGRTAGCGCARCRGGTRPWWSDPARRTAQIHAQNRMIEIASEAALARAAQETAYDTHEVKWKPPRPLGGFAAATAGDPRYGDAKRQWNYRIFLPGDQRPLYLGKSGPARGGIRARLMAHVRAMQRAPAASGKGATPADVARDVASAHRAAAKPGPDTAVLASIGRLVGPQNLVVSVGEVFARRRDRKTGKVSLAPAKRGAALLTERIQLHRGRARINRPDRVEEAAAATLHELEAGGGAW